MAKASREYVYGTNPAFEILRAKRRTVYGAWLNQSARDKPRMQKLVKLLEQHAVPMEWVEKGRLIQLSKSTEHQGVVLKTSLTHIRLRRIYLKTEDFSSSIISRIPTMLVPCCAVRRCSAFEAYSCQRGCARSISLGGESLRRCHGVHANRP